MKKKYILIVGNPTTGLANSVVSNIASSNKDYDIKIIDKVKEDTTARQVNVFTKSRLKETNIISNEMPYVKSTPIPNKKQQKNIAKNQIKKRMEKIIQKICPCCKFLTETVIDIEMKIELCTVCGNLIEEAKI